MRYQSQLEKAWTLIFLVSLLVTAPLKSENTADHSINEKPEWLKRCETNALAPFGKDDFAVIAEVEGLERRGKHVESPEDFNEANRWSIHGCVVSNAGAVRGFSDHAFGSRGGGGGKPIESADLKRLHELLEKLPEVGEVLPCDPSFRCGEIQSERH